MTTPLQMNISPKTAARERKRRQRSNEAYRLQEQTINTEAHRIARRDEIRRQNERVRDRELHVLTRQDEERRRLEQHRDRDAHITARQNEERRRLEQERDREYHIVARQDKERRAEEQERDREAHIVERQDEEKRRQEQERDREAHIVARQDEKRRRLEQERDREAHIVARQDLIRRRLEQERDREAHIVARQDEERRRLEQERDREAHIVARQDEERRRHEQTRNTVIHRNERQTRRDIGSKHLFALDKSLDREIELYYIGKFTKTCQYCNALHFQKEGIGSTYKICCHSGKVSLPPLTSHPTLQQIICNNNHISKKYLQEIRKLNSSLAFASMVANLEIPTGRGPFCFRIHGQIHHYIGAVHPNNNVRSYASLYFLDNEQALQERLQIPVNRKVNEDLLRQLQHVITTVNPFAISFKLMKEVEDEESATAHRDGREILPVSMTFRTDLQQDLRRFNKPRTSGIAVVFVQSDGEPPSDRLLTIHSREQGLKTISNTEPCRDPMVYPLLFPYGEYGWHVGLLHTEEYRTAKRQQITPLQFYAYRLSIRHEFSLIHSSGKLFQQYIVDCYVTVEGHRIRYIRDNQRQLRVEKYQGLMDYVNNRAEEQGITPGKMVILPSTFIGSPRNMQQRFQDAMAIVSKFGKPDLFITFTCNPKWKEITENIQPWETPENRPDIVARVFHLKLKELLSDLLDGQIFGRIQAYVYVIEFQKRGLPHCHLLIILEHEYKPRDQNIIDKIVIAEIPDTTVNSRLLETVQTCMVHGPCGNFNADSPCMDHGKCTKNYPKDYKEHTITEGYGYPLYRRRNDGKTLKIQVRSQNVEVDNRWIVPYNPYLSLKYNAHINVEVCSTVKAVKYLFKYVYKGYDCANIQITQHIQNQNLEWNEINTFLDSRYVSAPEAAWRLFEFEMHSQSHTIIRLAVHLPMNQNVYFTPGQESEAVQKAASQETSLTAWFKLNAKDVAARNIAYTDIPCYFVWQQTSKEWKSRQRGGKNIIGRMYYVSPSQQELYHLRLLLLHVRGAQSFEELKTVNGVLCQSFKEAARELHLLEDDTEWERCLQECVQFKMPSQLRHVFSIICVFCNPSNPNLLWDQFKDAMIDDYRIMHDVITSENKALIDIEDLMMQHGVKCADYGLPVPDRRERGNVNENNVTSDKECFTGEEMYIKLSTEQRVVVDEIVAAVNEQSENRIFFLDGPGGTGKTFVYKCIIYKLRGQNKSVLPVAWTGIAANLLPGGRTVHSTFKLPVPLLETSVSAIKPNTDLADNLRKTSLILWDEASMAHSVSLNILDRLLKDVTGRTDLFGNKVVVFGGDFRQVLPVVRHGSRTSILESSIKSWIHWSSVKQLKLTTNMRTGEGEQEFTDWLLRLGNGNLEALPHLPTECIQIPEKCTTENNLVTEIFGNKIAIHNSKEIKDKVILCPKNEHCFEINDAIVETHLSGESKTYYSVDTVVSDDQLNNIPIEYINSLTPAGLPPHKLVLKVGAIVMLIRNLYPKMNLVNGVRLRVTKLNIHTIEAETLESDIHECMSVLLPRIDLIPSDPTMPFNIKRRQFPIRIAFAMTINKAQGQTFQKVGLYLQNPVFTHGQLYVAFSRVKTFDNIKVKIDKAHGQGKLPKGEWYTKNIVFNEILQDYIH